MFKQVYLSKLFINEYKDIFKHVRFDKNTFGVALIDSYTNKLLGFIQTDLKSKYIIALYVIESKRREGLGKYLLDVATQKLGVDKLSVNRKNTNAIKLYKDYGYHTIKEDNTMFYMQYDNVKTVNRIIIGENHSYKEEIDSYFEMISRLKPEYYLHELIYEDRCLSRSEIKDRIDNTDTEGLCESWNKFIYDFAYKNNLKLIGIDLEQSPKNLVQQFKVREKHMIQVIKEFKNHDCVVQVGDTHLRSIRTSKLGNKSYIVEEFENDSLILRSRRGEIL